MTDKLDKARPQSWGVHVSVDGENVLTIETRMLSGIPDIEKHRDIVLSCADMLRSFIGPDEGEFFDPDTASAAGGGWPDVDGSRGAEEILAGLSDPVQPAPAAEDGDGPRAQTAVALGDATAQLLAAEDRINGLKEERDEQVDRSQYLADQLSRAQKAERAAEASLAALRNAAKPFAKIADDYDDREDGALLLRVDADQLKLTLGQCRAVRALLTDPTQSTQDDDSPVPAPTPDMGKVEEALEAAITCLRQAPAERREPATLIVCQAALSQLRSPNDG